MIHENFLFKDYKEILLNSLILKLYIHVDFILINKNVH